MTDNTEQCRMPRVRRMLAAAALGGASLLGGAPAWPAAADGLAGAPPTARTDKGDVVGTRVGAIEAFLGVPYAAPPVGDLRFRAPQPHAPWTTPVQATQVATPCPQVRPTNIGSEDCLYLNVYTPAHIAAADRPVMVYIPGGGFTQGSASSPYYDGRSIAEQAGVVVVVLTYRVGALGFLTAPALDAENPAKVSGNYGLLDQQAALRWVQNNIRAFGGNPHNVTLFGESAGADSTEYALVSPANAGLFQHAIVESSVGGFQIPNPPLALAEANGGATVLTAVGCAGAADVAACLRALPAYAFLNPAATPPGSSLPVVDGVVLPQQPLQAFRSGQFNRVPIILGTNHDEGTAFVWPIEAALGGPLTPAGYTTQLQHLYGAYAAEIQGEYPLSAYPTPIQALAAVYTDGNTACVTSEKRKALARYVPTYGYEFNEPNPAQGPLLGPPEPGLNYGAYHTAELPYVFGVSAPAGVPVTGKDLALSQRIIGYWTNLAISGTPLAPRLGTPLWFDYRLAHQLLSLKDQVTYLPESQFRADHHCAFWDSRLQE